MKLKKSLITTTLAIFALPLIANANLITTNNTAEYSSVIVTSNKNTCSGTSPVGVTYPHSTSNVTTGDVRALCGSKLPCHANIVMETSLNAAKTCSGIIIGWAEISDLNTDVVTAISVDLTKGYDATGVGTNHVTISQT